MSSGAIVEVALGHLKAASWELADELDRKSVMVGRRDAAADKTWDEFDKHVQTIEAWVRNESPWA